MNSGKWLCKMRQSPANSAFARWFSRNSPRGAPRPHGCLSNSNCWPLPTRASRPNRHTWPAVFIGNTAAKEGHGSILSRIFWSPRTPRCNAIAWRRSIAAISGATFRACACLHRSKPAYPFFPISRSALAGLRFPRSHPMPTAPIPALRLLSS
jgi:hypothetical protein